MYISQYKYSLFAHAENYTSPQLENKPLSVLLTLCFHTAGLGKSVLGFPVNVHCGGNERGFTFVLIMTIDTFQSGSQKNNVKKGSVSR